MTTLFDIAPPPPSRRHTGPMFSVTPRPSHLPGAVDVAYTLKPPQIGWTYADPGRDEKVCGVYEELARVAHFARTRITRERSKEKTHAESL